MGGRHHSAQQRQYYAKLRLAELRAICPDLPDDILRRVQLRQLSFAVRRAGRGHQTVLGLVAAAQGKRDWNCAQSEAEVRSTTEDSRQAHFQNSYHHPTADVTRGHQCVRAGPISPPTLCLKSRSDGAESKASGSPCKGEGQTKGESGSSTTRALPTQA